MKLRPLLAVLIAGAAVLAQAAPVFAATWSSTTDLRDGRYYHTATLLTDGRVLIAGGEGSNGPLASAELYDSRARRFAPASSMHVARVAHTATLLADGRVLIAGGQTLDAAGNRPVTPTAELYDPATDRFTPTGSMAVGRYRHTATLLPDGTVLVTGGVTVTDSQMTASAEIYDPRKGTWSSAGSMAEARFGHRALLLRTGLVLVAGGDSAPTPSQDPHDSAEVFDPAQRSWREAAPMPTSRTQFVFVLLPDGRVAAAGGMQFPGGYPTAVTAVDLYDPGSGRWTPGPPLQSQRGLAAGVVLADGSLLVVGGTSWNQVRVESTAELWRPDRPAQMIESPDLRRVGSTATLLRTGQVLVVGGVRAGTSGQLYDAAAAHSPPPANSGSAGTTVLLVALIALLALAAGAQAAWRRRSRRS